MAKVGKKTPVWQNKLTGQITCGRTVQEGLGVDYSFPVSNHWHQVNKLPKEKRVVISDNAVLPRNTLVCEIAKLADKPGAYPIVFGSRTYTLVVLYADSVRVIIK